MTKLPNRETEATWTYVNRKTIVAQTHTLTHTHTLRAAVNGSPPFVSHNYLTFNTRTVYSRPVANFGRPWRAIAIENRNWIIQTPQTAYVCACLCNSRMINGRRFSSRQAPHGQREAMNNAAQSASQAAGEMIVITGGKPQISYAGDVVIVVTTYVQTNGILWVGQLFWLIDVGILFSEAGWIISVCPGAIGVDLKPPGWHTVICREFFMPS